MQRTKKIGMNFRLRRRVFVSLLLLLFLLIPIGGGWWIFRTISSEKNPGINEVQDGVNALKLYTTEPGIYHLKLSEIRSKIHNDRVDGEIHLYREGVLIPHWFIGDGRNGELLFFADRASGEYRTESITWIVTGDEIPDQLGWPKTMVDTDGDSTIQDANLLDQLDPPQGSYVAEIQLEENSIYQPLVEDGDHWFWTTILKTIAFELPFQVSEPLEGKAILQIDLWSPTSSSLDPDHKLDVYLNGEFLNTETWDGNGNHFVILDVPSDLLHEGENKLIIQSPGIENVLAEIHYLDRVKLLFPRRAILMDGSLDIVGESKINTRDFKEGVLVFDITDPLRPSLVYPEEAKFSPQENNVDIVTEPGRRYLVVASDGLLQIPRIELPRLSPSFMDSQAGGDYLVVGPGNLLSGLQPLLDWRSSQGYKVFEADVEAVYDQFNFGYPEPRAIQKFLQHANRNWTTQPRFLLLVGDATYDPKGYISQAEANQLPVIFIQTVYGGQTGSDLDYIINKDNPDDLSGGKILDVAVGRLPAQTVEQIHSYVEKIISYEKELGQIQLRVLAIADGQEENFSLDAQEFLSFLPPKIPGTVLTPPAGSADASKLVLDSFKEGYYLIGYFGHGSIQMWGKDKILTYDEIVQMSNQDTLPVVINMTCLTGFFLHPEQQSLAEAFLWQKGAGAVAVLAPTSLTLPNDQEFLSKELLLNILNEKTRTWGEALLQARRKISLDDPGTRDVVYTFLYFGDPALRLP